MNITSFFLRTSSTAFGVISMPTVKFMDEPSVIVQRASFTNDGFFKDYPMDEVSRSLESADIAIPAHLQTIDEIDEWIMSL